MWHWLLPPIAYLLGSLSSAVIVSKGMGLPDPREQGSKNPGTTNVLRLGGKKAAIITLLGDAVKGLIPVLIAKMLGATHLIVGITGVAAFLGHLFPVFFQFKGGKGVATGLGVFLGFNWLLGGLVALTWIAMAAVFRISSLSALTAALLAPAYAWWLTGSIELTIAAGILGIILMVRHRGNIQRLLAGTEKRLGQ